MFVPHASEIWTKSFVQTTRNLEFFDKKKETKQNKTKQKKKTKKRVFKNHFWHSVDASLEDVSVAKGRQFFVVWN